MAVSARAVVNTVVTVESFTLTLTGKDAQILRSMLGGLRRKVRREAVKSNGGNKDSANRARFLVKEIIKAMDDEGITRLNEVPVANSAPDINGEVTEEETYPSAE